jgi:hypothetical protein
MATRVDAGGGFERVLPARSAADARPRGKPSSWAWTVPAVGLGILFLCLEVLVHEEGTSFLASRFRTRRDLVDVGGVDEVTRPPAATSAPTERSSPTAAEPRPPAEATALDWSMLLPDVETDARVFASRGAHATLGFACYSSPIPNADSERVAITRFEPVTTRQDSVHHITVFGCDARVREEHGGVTFGPECAAWKFTRASDKNAASPPCRVIVYAYDKGADAFEAPTDLAVHVGQGTGITHILFQVHYLAPLPEVSRREKEPWRPEPWRDASGVRFSLRFAGDVRDASRTTPMGILATMHTSMSLPANEKSVRFEYVVGPFSKRMAPDFAAAGEVGETDDRGARRAVTLVAAHMHGHGMLRRYEFGLVHPSATQGGLETREPIGVLEGYAGYGADQSFFSLPVRRMEKGSSDDKWNVANGTASVRRVFMRPEDSIYVRCTFDTRGGLRGDGVNGTNATGVASAAATRSVAYGVGHGEEMCGQLVYYYPFAADEEAVWGAMTRPEPRDDDAANVRDNELFNVFFGDDTRVNTTIERVTTR